MFLASTFSPTSGIPYCFSMPALPNILIYLKDLNITYRKIIHAVVMNFKALRCYLRNNEILVSERKRIL